MPATRKSTTKTTTPSVAKTTTRKRAAKKTGPTPAMIATATAQLEKELQSPEMAAALAANDQLVDAKPEQPAKPAKPAKPAAPAPAKRGPLELPNGLTPTKLVLQFVTERASSAPDAGGQARPFITHTGKLVIHAKWLRDYIAETLKLEVTVSQAVTMLRDLGYADRSVAVIGAATKNLSVWMIDAPRSMSKIERQAAPERKTAAKSEVPA